MRGLVLFILITCLTSATCSGSAPDSIYYQPEKPATFKAGNIVFSKRISHLTDSFGLFKHDFDRQHVKLYVIVNARGNIVNVVNGGCLLDSAVENNLKGIFLNLGLYEPAYSNGVAVASAKLFEFYLSPYTDAQFDVRVKLSEKQTTREKDFTHFIAMYTKWIDNTLYYPKKCKPAKLDGLVTIEFSFNAKGKPTRFTVVKSDVEDFVQSAYISLFMVKPIPADYLAMIGREKRFAVTFDFVAFSDMYGFLPSNH